MAARAALGFNAGMATTADTRLLGNYVGGRWVAATAGEQRDVQNPATGETLARVPLSSAADVDAAVAAARAALPEWRSRSVIERARWLFGLRQVIEAHADELARSVTREMGKTLPDARAEVGRVIEMVEAATAVPQTMQGRILEDVATNVDCETIRQPVGVCAAIVPFNFPAMVPFWFLPFAIACGNTFVLKPSEQVPLTQELVFNLIDDLGGLPAGVLNLVNGGADVVNALLDHPGVDAISFVGSAKVARLRLRAGGGQRQARAGARRGEELHGRHARRRHRRRPSRTSSAPPSAPPASAAWPARSSSPSATPRSRSWTSSSRARASSRSATASSAAPTSGRSSRRTARDRILQWIDRGIEGGATAVVDGRTPAPAPAARSSGRPSSTASRRTWTSPRRRCSGRCSR